MAVHLLAPSLTLGKTARLLRVPSEGARQHTGGCTGITRAYLESGYSYAAAQIRGNTGVDLAAFAREVGFNLLKFPTDIKEYSKNPSHREGKQQGGGHDLAHS